MQLPGYHPDVHCPHGSADENRYQSPLRSLRDEGIDPGELCIAQLDIYTAQNVDGIRNRFPVERRILGNVKTRFLFSALTACSGPPCA